MIMCIPGILERQKKNLHVLWGGTIHVINMHAVMSRWGHATIAINSLVIIVVEGEEKANRMGKTGELLKVTPLGILQ